MRYYPCYLDLDGKKVCVIGGGNVAKRKVELLLKTKANIHIISPELSSELSILVKENQIQYHCKRYEKEDIKDAWLVYAATNDHKLNNQIREDANKFKCFCNVITEDDSDLIVPSIIERGDLIISITTSGSFPGLSKKIKERLEMLFPKDYGKIINLLSSVRKKIIKEACIDSKSTLISILLEYADPELNLTPEEIERSIHERLKKIPPT